MGGMRRVSTGPHKADHAQCFQVMHCPCLLCAVASNFSYQKEKITHTSIS